MKACTNGSTLVELGSADSGYLGGIWQAAVRPAAIPRDLVASSRPPGDHGACSAWQGVNRGLGFNTQFSLGDVHVKDAGAKSTETFTRIPPKVSACLR